MIDFFPEKGVVLLTQQGICNRLFDHFHPSGGYIAYPLKRKTPQGFVKLEKEFLSGTLAFERFTCGNVDLPFVSKDKVCEVFTPRESLRSRYSSVRGVDRVIEALTNVGIPFDSLGFDGSNVYGGATSDSDLDLLVFGEENRRKLLANLEQIAERASLRRYSANVPKLVERRKRHLGEMSGMDVAYECEKPVFFRPEGGTHVNISPTHPIDDSFMDISQAQWRLRGNVSLKVRLLSTHRAMQLPATYEVESLDPQTKVDAIHTNMFYHALKGKPGQIVEVAGPLVECARGERSSNRIILSSWGNYQNFRFSFIEN